MGRRGGKKTGGVTRKRNVESNTLDVTAPTTALLRLNKTRKVEHSTVLTTENSNVVRMENATVSDTMTSTQNGSISHTTSNCARLDLFYSGFVRNSEKIKIFDLMQKSWTESPIHTVSLLLHSRDCRSGKGEKLVSYYGLLWLRTYKTATYLLNLATFLNYGYFKDLLTVSSMVIEDKLPSLGEKDLIELELFAECIQQDMNKLQVWEEQQANKNSQVNNHTTTATSPIVATEQSSPSTSTATTEPTVSPAKDEEFVIIAPEDIKVETEATATPVTATTHATPATAESATVTSATAAPTTTTTASSAPQSFCMLTLAGKWAPSERGAHDKQHNLAKRLATLLFPTHTQPRIPYRKMLSKLRAHLNVVERLCCSQRWSEIQFAKVPAKAHNLLKKAFEKHEAERYKAYLESVKKGEVKINTAGLQPHELVQQYLQKTRNETNDTIEVQWQALVNKLKETGSLSHCVSLVDVSGSMTCNVGGSTRALDVAMALGLLTAELTSEPFKNRIITFSANPQWHVIKGADLRERVLNLESADWGGNTNVLAAFKMILEVAKQHKVPATDMPKQFFIYSDMQFDAADSSFNTKTMYENVQLMYRQAGYEAPALIYWNINGGLCHDIPVKYDTPGVAMISGFSGELLKLFMNNTDLQPMTLLLSAIEPYMKHVKVDEIEK